MSLPTGVLKREKHQSNCQTDRRQVRNWLKDEEKIRSLKRSKKTCRYGKAKFQGTEKELYTKFLDKRKKVTVSSVGGLTPKHESWWNKSILIKQPPLSYHTDGFRVFVDVIEYPSEENLTLLKSHQQLYVPLLRNSMQSLPRGHKREIFTLKDLGNIDQKSLPFVMNKNRTWWRLVLLKFG